MSRVINPSSPNELKKVNSELRSVLAEKESQLNSMTEGSLALQVQLEISQGKSARLTSENLLLKGRVKELEQEHTTRNTELATLSKLILQSEERSQHDADQIKKAGIEIENSKKETLKIKTALDLSNTKLNDCETQYKKLKVQLEHEKEKNKTLTNKVSALQDNLNTRFSELATMTNILEMNERKLMSKDNELSIYKDQLDKLKGSFSWKVAAPARAISKKLKKKNSNGKLAHQIEIIQNSGLFNTDWYRQNCPELEKLSLSPVEHYLSIGFKMGLSPSERFDGNDYLSRYPDVQQEGVNPLLHYLMFGKNEGRTI